MCGGGRGTTQHLFFSASHVIFIVNNTHLAFLSEQGLVRDASFHGEEDLGVKEGKKESSG